MKKITLKQIDKKLNKIIKLLNPEEVDKNKLITIVDDGKLKTSEILDKCRKLFPVWFYYFNKKLDKQFPPVKSKRKFKYVQEADEDLVDKSANDLEKEGIKGITLRERLLFELIYYKKEEKHLDIKYITLCSGSRYADGDVPSVRWDDGRFEVNWYHPGDAGGHLRSRQAV